MIHWSRWSVDLRWMFENWCYIHLIWSCFHCPPSKKQHTQKQHLKNQTYRFQDDQHHSKSSKTIIIIYNSSLSQYWWSILNVLRPKGGIAYHHQEKEKGGAEESSHRWHLQLSEIQRNHSNRLILLLFKLMLLLLKEKRDAFAVSAVSGKDNFRRAICVREGKRRGRIPFIDLGKICPNRPIEKSPINTNSYTLNYGTSDQHRFLNFDMVAANELMFRAW